MGPEVGHGLRAALLPGAAAEPQPPREERFGDPQRHRRAQQSGARAGGSQAREPRRAQWPFLLAFLGEVSLSVDEKPGLPSPKVFEEP